MIVWLKRVGALCLILIGLALSVAALLYVPAVQNALLGKAADYASEAIGLNVSFARVRIGFPLRLNLHEALVLTHDADTVAYIEKLSVHVRLKPLFNGVLSVKSFIINDMDVNTKGLNDGVIINGRVGEAAVRADSVAVEDSFALVNKLTFKKTDLKIFVCDTTAANDTVASPLPWRIALKEIELDDVGVAVNMPCDSFYLALHGGIIALKEGFADIGNMRYIADNMRLALDSLFYYTNVAKPAAGLDFQHINITDLIFKADTLKFGGLHDLAATVNELSFNERSGLNIKSLTGSIYADSTGFFVPSLALETAHSAAQIEASAPFAALDKNNPTGNASIKLTATIGDDFFNLTNTSNIVKQFVKVDVLAEGNMKNLNLKTFTADMQEAFCINMKGNIKNLLNDRLRNGAIDYRVETKDIKFIEGYLSQSFRDNYRIPDSMSLGGILTMQSGFYSLQTEVREGNGVINLSADYNVINKSYNAALNANNFSLTDIMRIDSLVKFNAGLTAKGKGFDFYHFETWAEINAQIDNIVYGNAAVSGLSLSGRLKDNKIAVNVISLYPLIRGSVNIKGEIKRNDISGKIIADVDTLDIKGLKLTEGAVGSKFHVTSDFTTDMDKRYTLAFTLKDWSLNVEEQYLTPKQLNLTLTSLEDTTLIAFKAGDMEINAVGNNNLPTLISKMSALADDAAKQLKQDSIINFEALRKHYPDMAFKFKALQDNPLYNFLQESNIYFDNLLIDATISPSNGLNVSGSLLSFVKDTLKIDTVQLNINQDTVGLNYHVAATKKRFRNQEAFYANVNGYIHENEADIFAEYINSKGEKGVSLGVKALKAGNGFDFRLYPEMPVIAFMPFKINSDNSLHFVNMKNIKSNLRLEGADNSSLWIHTGEDTENRDVMVEVNHFDLAKISSGFTDMPAMKGLFSASLRYVPADKTFMIVGDCNIDEFYYQGGQIGSMVFSVTYMPMEINKHQIDIHILHDYKEVGVASVLYTEKRKNSEVEGIVTISELPLKAVNPLVPAGMLSFDGAVNGELKIKGSTEKPVTEGYIQLDKATLFAASSSSSFRFDDRQVKITDNRMVFDSYKIFDSKNNAFVVAGNVSDLTGTPTVDLKLTASNLQPLEATRKPESVVWGRLYADLNTTLKGSLNALRMRGDVHILGNTNMNYLAAEASPEVQDNFAGLVTFTYFADSLPRRQRRTGGLAGIARNVTAMSGGTDIFLNIKIDPLVKLRIDLNEERTNHVEMRGGGDLSFQYNRQGGMSLNGRYTMSEGTIRYAVPVIPLTDFTVSNGSYADWTGDPFNPMLNITAYTRVRSSVNFDGQSRMVDFNTGIEMKNNLNDMAIQFILDAPSDAVVQNQLTAMGSEERSKQAISLLVAGLYLAGNGVGGENLDVGAALNTLLQREIKNILGNVLGEVPFTFDVNTYDGTLGMGRRIDYLGRFYKTFFDERFKTELGLRYSTKDPVYGNRLLLDDVSLEYRLDRDGTRSFGIFRSKEYENLFEGEITKTGAAFTVRRKVKRLSDLFLPPKSAQ
ncbi:MAG: translocation/assembly module TamB [Tannerella sp.]|jgi:hypothetical protein|nr:translocation/assembly module TamB [Tannerella sp.]